MLRPNTLLQGGRYRIIKSVGEGAQGSVYEALAQHLNTNVAIKEAEMNMPRLFRAFEREAQRLARLRHPALPKALDYFSEGGRQYFVMEYIEGLDLSKQLDYRGRAFPVPDVLRWADDLLDVLDYLHSQPSPLIHRDIKPANLKIAPNGQIILLDFGIATGGLTQGTTATGWLGYTLGYAPPEQEKGEQTDERSDIYALGASLYHLLTNQRPTRAIIREIQNPDPVRPANELNPQVPPELANILARAMALDPAQRFASAADMRAMLAQINFPPAPPPPPPPPEPPGGVLRRFIALAVIILFGAIITGVVLWMMAGESNEPTPTNEATAEVASTTVTVHPPENGEAVTPTASLSATATSSATKAPPASQEPPKPTSPPRTDLPVLVGTPIPPAVAAISPSNAQQVVQLARWGKGQIQEVAYSPGRNCGLRIANCGTEEIRNPKSEIRNSPSPDGTRLAAATTLGIYLYDAETLEQIAFIESNHAITSVAFSPDGQTLVSGSRSDPTVRLWRVSDGMLLASFEGHEDETTVNRVTFSPDGERLASASDDGSVRLWNVSAGTLLHTLWGHTGGVTTVAFSPDGQSLVSGSYDNTVRVWQATDGSLLYALTGHTDWVRDVAFSPNGQLVASSSQDGMVRLWQGEELLYALSDFAGRVERVAFSPDGQRLATASYFDQHVSLWRLEDGTLLETLKQRGVSDVRFSPDGQTLVTLYWGHSLSQWRQPDGESEPFTRLNQITDHTNGMTSVAISDSGEFVASGSYDERVRVWRLSDNTQLYRLGDHSGHVTSVAFSGDVSGQEIPFLASGSRDQTVLIWQGEEIINTLKGHEGEIMSVDFTTTEQRTIASGSKDRTVRLWRSEALLHTLEGHSEEVTSVAFSQDGQIVISGSKDKHVKVWQVEDGSLLYALGEHSDKVESVAIAQNGQLIAAGLKDGTIAIWQQGTQLATLEGHTGSVNGVSFTPDGNILATASDDATIRLWRIENGNGTLLHTLQAHNLPVSGVAFTADGKLLATSSDDGTVRLWGIP
ncbi:MAG: protein kinase domain-containing protein [Ardenticatenaceae bacterium]